MKTRVSLKYVVNDRRKENFEARVRFSKTESHKFIQSCWGIRRKTQKIINDSEAQERQFT